MPNEELKEQNVQRVILSGMDCFKKYGIENTSKAKLAQESGVSCRSISRYYANKEAFVLAVLKFNIDKHYEKTQIMRGEVTLMSGTGLEKVKMLLKIITQSFVNDSDLYILLAEAQLYLCHHKGREDIARDYISNYCLLAGAFKECIELGIADGSVRRTADAYQDGKVICQMVFGFFIQIALAKKMYGYTDETEKEVIDHFIEQMLCSLN